MKVTTWAKRRQRERQAVSREVEVIEPRNLHIGVVDMLINMEDKIRCEVMGYYSGRSRGLIIGFITIMTLYSREAGLALQMCFFPERTKRLSSSQTSF